MFIRTIITNPLMGKPYNSD